MEDLKTFLIDAKLEHLFTNFNEQEITLEVLVLANDNELSVLAPKVVDKIKLRTALQKLQNKSLPDDSYTTETYVKPIERQCHLLYMPNEQELTSIFGSTASEPTNTAQKSNELIQELNTGTEHNLSLASPELDECHRQELDLIVTSTPEAPNTSIQTWNAQITQSHSELEILGSYDHKNFGNDNGRSLRRLLTTVTVGKQLVEKADNNEKLTPRDRAFIVKLIVETELRSLTDISTTIRKNIWENWANEVACMFKGESATIYYVPYHVIGGKVIQASGLFHNRLITHRRLLSTQKRKRSTSSESSDSSVGCSKNYNKRVRPLPETFTVSSPDVNSSESSNFIKDCLDWLKASSSPQDLVAAKWLTTIEHRNQELSEGLSYKDYFNRFPALQLPTGHNLLSLDFETVYPNANRVFEERYPIIKTKILELLAEKASCTRHDETCIELLNLATVGEEQASLAAFLAIVNLLRQMPTICVPRKKVWKLSKEEVRSSFIGRVLTSSDIDRYCADREALVASKGIPEQPFIVAVGSSWATVTHYEIVIFRGLRYQISDICSAITKTFHIYWALDSAYPKDSAICWMFVQRAIFKMKSRYDTEGVPLREFLQNFDV